MTSAVVIGAGSGIGAEVAAVQRAAGIEVVTWDVSQNMDVQCDIRDQGQIRAAVAQTVQSIGVPSFVTVTAGVGHAGSLMEATPEEWHQVVGTNAMGVWMAMRGLAKPMMSVGGSIVVTSSISASLADPGMGLYCVSKAALDMLVRVAAIEWSPTIRVNAISPGVTDTAMLGGSPRDRGWLGGVAERTALRRLGTPADIGAAILALHGMGWVTGQSVICDGGLSLHSPITRA
jgi:NAD(P)-dependent dehydrogenase (short-subunit alcohol dehydrogenase family)